MNLADCCSKVLKYVKSCREQPQKYAFLGPTNAFLPSSKKYEDRKPNQLVRVLASVLHRGMEGLAQYTKDAQGNEHDREGKFTSIHTHSDVKDGVERHINVSELFKIVARRKPIKLWIKDLIGSVNRSRRSGFSEKRLKETDTSFPLLVEESADGHKVFDGRHRLLKQTDQGKRKVEVHVLKPKDIARAALTKEEHDRMTGMARPIATLALYVKDSSGHEHRGKGQHGGEFAPQESAVATELSQAGRLAKQMILATMVGGAIGLGATTMRKSLYAVGNYAKGMFTKPPPVNPFAAQSISTSLFAREPSAHYKKDASGHEHKEKGKGGGQFAPKGGKLGVGAGVGIGAGGAAALILVGGLAHHLLRKRGVVDLAPYAYPPNMPDLPEPEGKPQPFVPIKTGWIGGIVKRNVQGKIARALEANKHLTIGDVMANLKAGNLPMSRGLDDLSSYKKDASGHEHAADGRFGTVAGEHKAAPKHTQAFLVNSKIGGYLPKLFALHHRSVCTCPAGQPAVVDAHGTKVSNPACTCFGTQPNSGGKFTQEPQRVDATAQPIKVKVENLMTHINAFDKPYRLLTSNCQHAVNAVIRLSRRERKSKFQRALEGMIRYEKVDANGELHDNNGRFAPRGGKGRSPTTLQAQPNIKTFGKRLGMIGLAALTAAGLGSIVHGIKHGWPKHGIVEDIVGRAAGWGQRVVGKAKHPNDEDYELTEKQAQKAAKERIKHLPAELDETERKRGELASKLIEAYLPKAQVQAKVETPVIPESIALVPQESILPSEIELTDPAREARNSAARQRRLEQSEGRSMTKGFVPHSRDLYDQILYAAMEQGQTYMEASCAAAEAEYQARFAARTPPDLADPRVRAATEHYLRSVGYDELAIAHEMELLTK